MHLQACFASWNGRVNDFPEAEAAARETLALPIFPELGEERIERVVDLVSSFMQSRS
jgi:dTDP-4-amino-4,6-dideoxygalactose transaminase